MKTTITLTPENSAALGWSTELTGLSIDEIANLLLADMLSNFRPDNDDSFPHEEIGCWSFNDRASAKRTLEWVRIRAREGSRGKFPIIETGIRERKDGRFEIDAFKTDRNGEYDRIC